MANSVKCDYIYEDGRPCKAWARRNSTRCVRHPLAVEASKPEPELVADEFQETPVQVSVSEPVALTKLRESLTGQLPPEILNTVLNVLRPMMGLPEVPQEDLAKLIDMKKGIDQAVAEQEEARERLIARSRQIIERGKDVPQAEKDKVMARAMQDVTAAAGAIQLEKQATIHRLMSEEKIVIAGPFEDEVFNINGVIFKIPAGGLRKVPRSVVMLYQERMRGYAELAARKAALSADGDNPNTPEIYRELPRRMAAIDEKFKTRTQLSGGLSATTQETFVAEEYIAEELKV